jgi:predicted Zn-dependent protease
LIDNFSTGNSQVELFAPSSGISTETNYFSGLNGTGTDTKTISDLTNGGSQEQVYSSLPTGVNEQVFNYTGANDTGTLTSSITDYTNNSSVEQIFTGNPSGVSTQLDYYSGLNDTGKLNENVTDYTNNTSQVELFAPNSAITTELEHFSGLNGSGSLTGTTDNLNSGNDGTLNISNATVNLAPGTTATIDGSGLTIDANSSDRITLNGSYDTITGGTSDTFNITGTYDPINSTDSTINYSGSDTGNTVTGSRDTGKDWFSSSINPPDNPPINPPDNPPINPPDGGYDGGGDGFAANKVGVFGSNISSIYSYDLSHGNSIGASIAENALKQVQSVIASGNDSAVLEGAKWDKQVITWSFAESPIPNLATPLNGYVDASYQNTIDNVFQAWAAASGLDFEQVADSANSDIRIGWADLGTPQTGLVGFTNFQVNNGVMQHAVIELENPNQNSLVASNNNNLIYSGTSTSLSQVFLHEIGHAIGLADNANASSIMSYALGSNNNPSCGLLLSKYL